MYYWDWPGAEGEFKRAIELNPNSAEAHEAYGFYLGAMGRHEESIAEMKRAQELDPLSLGTNLAIGWAFHYTRQYDQAIEQFRKTLEMDPNLITAHQSLGWAYEQKGMYKEAVAVLQKAIGLSGGGAMIKAQLVYTYAVSGKRGEAEKALAELLELTKQRYVSPYFIAMIYAGLDEKDQAFAWLEKAYAERSWRLVFVNVNPVWNSLRSDPRFRDLLRRVGLKP